jgi:radical SAM superfamily enzyme YgiQ (UPF0313 family)
MRKKLLLINPIPPQSNITVRSGQGNLPPLNLGYIAALTPADWEIEILDESLTPYAGQEADLVGFTVLTYNAPRAYTIASRLRAKGIGTVMGGIHASVLPDEAARFTDTVVIGEADNIWGTVIADFEAGRMQPRYEGTRESLDGLPHPRHDLYSRRYPIRGQIQTARGCPMNCDFCSVSAFNGGTYRQRPVEDVLNELETLDTGFVIFVDDNILGHGPQADQRAIRIFKGILERGMKFKWFGQASINIANNPEVLRYAARSGCIGLFIGFESVNEEALKNMHKAANVTTGVARYQECIDKINDHGMSIVGGFIFGDDLDTKDVFDRTIEFVLTSKLDASQFNTLNPLPGTRVYERLKQEGRLLYTNYPHDWVYHDAQGNVLYRPKQMTPQELQEGVLRAYKETMRAPRAFARFLNSLHRTRNPWSSWLAYMWNSVMSSEFIKRYDQTGSSASKGMDFLNNIVQGILVAKRNDTGNVIDS